MIGDGLCRTLVAANGYFLACNRYLYSPVRDLPIADRTF